MNLRTRPSAVKLKQGKSLLIYTVEDGNPERSETLRRALLNVENSFISSGWRVLIATSPAPVFPPRPPSLLGVLLWQSLSELELRSFQRWMGDSLERPNFRRFLTQTYDRMQKLATDPDHRTIETRNASKEREVSKKHIFGWRLANRLQTDFLIVLEDDVIASQDSSKRLAELSALIFQIPSNQLQYVDIAGGFPHSALNLPPHEEIQKGIIKFSKPVTNTAAGYLLSLGLIARFSSKIRPTNLFRLIGIDFLMNRLLRDVQRSQSVDCMHFWPPIVEHGSMKGTYKSWTLGDFDLPPTHEE